MSIVTNEASIDRLVSQGREHLAGIEEQGVGAGVEFANKYMIYTDLDRFVSIADFDVEEFDLYVLLIAEVPPSLVNMLYEPTISLVTPLKIEAWEKGVVRGFEQVLHEVNSRLELT